MGADLYIESVFAVNKAKYEPQFNEWVERRDALQKQDDLQAAKEAQAKVVAYYDKMYERGYFRDSYNPTGILRLFGLSWWQDISQLIDEEGDMSPERAKEFLQMLQDRETIFEAALHDPATSDGWEPGEHEHYFRDKYARLQAFLNEAITLGEAIFCSI